MATGYSNKLCNPTPYEARWNWQAGVDIVVPAFGDYELPSVQMVDDFRDGRPGSENVRQNMAVLGIFLMDPNRSYDTQAFECLKSCIEFLQNRYNEGYQNIRTQLAQRQVRLDDENIAEIMRQHHLTTLGEKIEVLKKLAATYEAAVTKETFEGSVKTYDPEKTIFVTDPPREFPSKTAMEAFLNLPGNIRVREAHEEQLAKMNKKAAASPKKGKEEVSEAVSAN